MRSKAVSHLVAPLFLAAALAAPLLAAEPAEQLAGKVDAVFAQYAKPGSPGSPGCSLAVIRDGGIVYEKGYGFASVENGVAIDPKQTVFDIGSTSKQFTAASILLLARDGKLSLDDDIHKYVPELPNYGTPVTLRHLLHHTSGMRDYINLMVMGDFTLQDLTTDADALAVLARQKKLDFAPGSEFSYSNSGYFLLSLVVQRVSGKSLRDFAQERIFTPLGMTNTRYVNDHATIVLHRATGYAPRPEGGFGVEMSNWEQTGDGAVNTTVEDLAKWDRNFYDPKVGGPWLIDQLQTTGKVNDGEAIEYARGLVVSSYRGLRNVSHGGSWTGYRAELTRFPRVVVRDGKLFYVRSTSESELRFLGNGRFVMVEAPGTEVSFPPAAAGAARRMRLVTGSAKPLVFEEEQPPTALQPGDLAAYAGTYSSAELDTFWILKAEDGHLVLHPKRGEVTPLEPAFADTFNGPAGMIRFQRDAAKKVTGFTVGVGRARDLQFTKGPGAS